MNVIFREQANLYSIMEIDRMPEDVLSQMKQLKLSGRKTLVEAVEQILLDIKQYIGETKKQTAIMIDFAQGELLCYKAKITDSQMQECFDVAGRAALGNRKEMLDFMLKADSKENKNIRKAGRG